VSTPLDDAPPRHHAAGVSANVDGREVARFDALASRWWDADGDFRALHDINPLRLEFVAARTVLARARAVDVGCGGGILSEALAARGASVTGIDASGAALAVARLHGGEVGIEVDYRHATAEQFAAEAPGAFDVVTCMELLEHVPDPDATLAACARLARPGGDVFVSTLNRTLRAYLLAVLGAEYVLGLLPRGTHDYGRFLRPSELAAGARRAGLELRALTGMRYDPFLRRARLARDLGVNYLAWLRRPAPGERA